MCPSAYRVSAPQDPGRGGGRGQGSNQHQNLHWTGGDVLANFIGFGAGVWISCLR